MSNSRTVNTKRNFMFSMAGRIVGMITSFIGRGIFAKTLNSEYLGLGGFFGNIFSLVSLCELGIGAAICQSLYKPLAKGDEREVAAIIRFFAKVNGVIALLTLVMSLCAMPILPMLNKSVVEKEEMYAAYILFALHTALSYVLSPKKSLVVCDQKMYVVTAVNTVVSVVSLILQSVVLVYTKSYLSYLVTRVFLLALRDIAINRYADKKYAFLGKKINPSKGYYRMIAENTRSLVWHKIGGTLNRSTDSILLSVSVGLAGLGKYSNYALVIGTVGAFFDVAIGSVSASVGNLGAGDRGEKSEKIMRKMYFLNFFLLTTGLCVLVSTINPFISLWLGEAMLFSNGEMWIIAACFYFSCIRDPVQIFLHTYGLFRQTRFVPLIRAIVNFVLSVVLVDRMGIFGIFLGTVVSTVTVPLFWEVKTLYKYGFGNMKMSGFLKEMCEYIFVSASVSAACFAITQFFAVSLWGIVARAAVSAAVCVAVLWFMYRENENFAFFKKTVTGALCGKFRRINSKPQAERIGESHLLRMLFL